MKNRLKILIIVGPTASGKTALAVELGRKFGGEVISADSRQVYRELTIGSAKATRKEMRGIPHHLLNVASASRKFTAFDFRKKALAAIENISRKQKLPIVAGGTGFYVDALLGRISLPDIPANLTLRKQLERRSEKQLFSLLKKRDPKRARTIDVHNKRRLIRALEIAESRRANIKGLRNPYIVNITGFVNPYFDALWIGLKPDAKTLRKKIDERAAEQVRRGLVAEVRKLRAKKISWARIREFGFEYAAAADLLQGNIDKGEMLSRIGSRTWRYSRRQISYWKRNPDIKWFKPKERNAIHTKINAWLKGHDDD